MLLERANLMDLLAGAVADASKGRGRVVLLGGEAGAGKSALLRTFAERTTAMRVLWGACELRTRLLHQLLVDAYVGELRRDAARADRRRAARSPRKTPLSGS